MKKMLILLSLLLASANAVGGGGFSPPYSWVDVPGSGSKTVNRGYVGLKWVLDEGVKPQTVVGFRHAIVASNGDTDGGDISLSAKLFDRFQLGKLRAKYFNGKESVQGEFGGGYDFTKGFFAGIGVHAPYSLLGLDVHPLLADKKFEPYVQVDTIKKYNKPNGSTRECVYVGSGGDYYNADCTSPL